MRLDSVCEAITNSSSELFTFGTKSLDEVYDALVVLWDDYRKTPEAVSRGEEYPSLRWELEYGGLQGLVVLAKDDDGFVYVREEEERLLEHLGFDDVIRQHFGDLITYNSRT